jgi:hypothetical protein
MSPLIILFRNPFWMNLRLLKPYAVIKGTRWLKYNVCLIWCVLWLSHLASQFPVPANITMCQVAVPGYWCSRVPFG